MYIFAHTLFLFGGNYRSVGVWTHSDQIFWNR